MTDVFNTACLIIIAIYAKKLHHIYWLCQNSLQLRESILELKTYQHSLCSLLRGKIDIIFWWVIFTGYRKNRGICTFQTHFIRFASSPLHHSKYFKILPQTKVKRRGIFWNGWNAKPLNSTNWKKGSGEKWFMKISKWI